MYAKSFIEEKERMCKTCGSCFLCPAWLDDGCVVSPRSGVTSEQQINIVKEWAEQYPRKTRQQVFLEQYPNARIDSDGILYACPGSVFNGVECDKNSNHYLSCDNCRRKFWSKVV